MRTPPELLAETARRHRRLLVASSLIVLAGSLASLTYPWLAGNIATALIGRTLPELDLSLAFGALAVLVLVQSGIALLTQWVWSRSHTDAVFELRVRVYDQLQRLALEGHTERTRGEVLTLLERDCESIASFVANTLVGIVPALVTLVGAAILMVGVTPLYGGLTMLLVPIYVVGLRLIRRRMRYWSDEYADAYSKANQVADEQIAMLPVIKGFGREAHALARLTRAETRSRQTGRRLYFGSGAVGPVSELVGALGAVLLLWTMSGEVGQGRLSAPDFLVFFGYAFLFTRPLSQLAGVYGAINSSWGSATRLAALFDQPRERQGGAKVAPFERALSLEQVHFAYSGRPPLFEGIRFEVRRGEVTVVLGANGAGKSTLLKLLLGFLTPAHGEISIDGISYSELSLRSLRRQFAVVPQEMMLLSGTIYENIAFGLPRATPERVAEAARLAHADSFIAELPEGYQTRVGEGGILLSGGQRQRIALARALIKDAPILIFDEATAMLDAATEAAFFASCRRVFEQHTVLVVSHSLADLSFADRVVRIERGRLLVEPGAEPVRAEAGPEHRDRATRA